MAATDPATHRQLAFIKQLAYERGVSFIPPDQPPAGQPADRPAQASEHRSPRFEIADDRQATVQRHGEHAPASSPTADEISGYGSHAHWRHRRPPRR